MNYRCPILASRIYYELFGLYINSFGLDATAFMKMTLDLIMNCTNMC